MKNKKNEKFLYEKGDVVMTLDRKNIIAILGYEEDYAYECLVVDASNTEEVNGMSLPIKNEDALIDKVNKML